MKNKTLFLGILVVVSLIIAAFGWYIYSGLVSTQPPIGDTCKDLCGDGICQEVVCEAIGCSCPETPESCPQDCAPTISNLDSKSCNELEELKTKEFDRLDFSCKIDTDCSLIPIACGLCVNRNTNTEKYEEIYNVMVKKACIPTPGCLRAEYKCLCLNNKCELKVIPLESWKTYKSEEYGFEVKYPNDWYYHVSDFEEVNRVMICFNPENVSEDECIIVLMIDEDTSLEEWYISTKQMLEEGNTITESITTIESVEAKVITTDATVGLSKTLFFEKNGNVYNLAMETGKEFIFEEMLSTFKFLE